MLLTDSGEFYIVQFEDGTYYKGGGFSTDDVRTTDNINNARLYEFDWQVVKDLYLRMFTEARKTSYKILKVISKRSTEIVDDQHCT